MLNDPEEMSVCSLHKVRPLWMISVNLSTGVTGAAWEQWRSCARQGSGYVPGVSPHHVSDGASVLSPKTHPPSQWLWEVLRVFHVSPQISLPLGGQITSPQALPAKPLEDCPVAPDA